MAYHEKNIRLQEAMTKELKNPMRVWSVDGIHAETQGLPENAKVKETFVMKAGREKYTLGFNVETHECYESATAKVGEFHSLEELKEKYPNLFEMEGTLFAFP